MEGLYIIGGSPCSGKSTIAEMIAEKYDFNYFKVDDYLEQYMKKAQEDGKPLSARAMQMSPEELTEKLSRQRMVVSVRCGYNL